MADAFAQLRRADAGALEVGQRGPAASALTRRVTGVVPRGTGGHGAANIGRCGLVLGYNHTTHSIYRYIYIYIVIVINP